MFYFDKEPDINGNTPEAKQHIQLSDYAWKIIETDIFEFAGYDLSKERKPFLNRIFRGMYSANLSPANLTKGVQDQLSLVTTLIKTNGYQETDTFIKDLKNAYISTYKPLYSGNTAKSINTRSYKLRIEDKTNEIFIEMGNNSIEERVFGSRCNYLKEVYETYARKTTAEREMIYYWDNYNKIQSAIENQNIIHFQTNGFSQSIMPIIQLPDTYNLHYYVLGYDVNKEITPKGIVNKRLSKINSVSNRGESFRIKTSQKNEVIKRASESSATFAYSKVEDYVIYLTSEGMRKYNQIFYIRPPYSSIAEINKGRWKYQLTIRATAKQIEFYFLKFCSDAYIKSPDKLRATFENEYKWAYSVYSKNY